MTPFLFYLQIRRVELKNDYQKNNISNPSLKFDIKEVTRQVSLEWKDLDENKKKHFNIPYDIQA